LLTNSDKTNNILSLSQKELLHWHWRFGHENLQWIQRLITNRTEDTLLPQKQPPARSALLHCVMHVC